MKIANGYKVSFTSLVEEKNDAVSVIRQADMQPLKEDGGRYLNYPVFPFHEQKLFETYRIVIKSGGSLSAQPYLKGAEEYITVFAGQAEITVGEERFQLSKGDSIRFHADVPHAYQNVGEETAELSMLIYYGQLTAVHDCGPWECRLRKNAPYPLFLIGRESNEASQGQ